MKKRKRKLTQKRVRELFNYQNGELVRKVQTRYNVKIGDIAGCFNSRGYVIIGIDGKRYKAHRIIWLFHYGYLPENDIDHIDQNPANNRIENLREVSKICNRRNCGNYINNLSNIKGVSWESRNKRWRVHIKINGKQIYLGQSKCLLEAACLRLAAEQAENWSGCESSSPAYQYVKANLFNKD